MGRLFCRLLLVFPIGCSALLCEQSARAQLPSGTNWALTFADEFNGTTLDNMKWSNGHPWDQSSSYSSNVAFGGGYLNLNAVRYNSSTFSGAGISTRPPSGSDLFDMTYGYVEARMKMPSLLGSWPAFWMLGNGWPPELDICEDPAFVDGSFNPYYYSDNIHYTNSGGVTASDGNGVHYAGVGDLTAGFHNYGMGWTPNSLTFYCDGNAQWTTTDPTEMASLLSGGPMYMLLDNSGGGSWPGMPSESQWPDGATSTVQVDWVRVWKGTSGSAASIAWSNSASNGSGSWTNASVWSGGQVPQLSSQTAVFGANAVNNQTVTWNNSQTVGGLTLNSSTSYTIGSAAGSLMLTGFTSTGTSTVLIDATSASGSGANYLNCRLELYNNVTMQTSSKPLIVGGSIIGAGNLTIAAGPVSLTNGSSYSGGTTLNGGTLTAAANSALGSGAVQFNAAGNGYTAELALTGGIELDNSIYLTGRNNSTAAIDNTNGINTLGGQIALQSGGSSYAVKSDSGQLTLSGAAGGGAAVTLAAGLSGTRTVTFLGAGNTLVSGAMTNGNAGSLAVAVNGPGSVVLTASNSYTGGTTIGGGTLQIGGGGAAGSLAAAGPITDNGTLAFDRGNGVAQGIDFSSAPIAGTGVLVQLGGGTLTLSNSNSYSGGTLIDAGTLLLTGSLNPVGGLGVGGGAFLYAHAPTANQAVSGLSVYPGASTIGNTTAGTLALGPLAARYAGGTVDFLATTGAVTTTATNTNGILGSWAFVGTGAGTAYAAVSGGTIGAYAGAILESSNTSAWGGIPSGDNHAANYEITANGAFPQTALQCSVNTIQYAGSGGTQTSSQSGVLLAANGIINTGSGPLVIGGGSNALSVQAGASKELVIGAFTSGIVINNSVADSASGPSALTKVGPGVLTLAGSNNYTGGTYLDAGSISISTNSSLGGSGGTAGAVAFNGGMLTTTAGIANTHAFTIGPSGGTINVSSTNTSNYQYYFHTANTLLGSGPLTLTGPGTLTPSLGCLRVDQTNPYGGNMTLQSGGIFEYGAAAAVASIATFTVNNQGELAVQGASATALPNHIAIGSGAGYPLAGGVLSFENGNGGVFSGTVTLNASAVVGLRDWYNNAVARQGAISGQVTGSGSLSINSGSGSGGALALGNSANDYRGGTTVANAFLLIGSPTIGGSGTTVASEAGALGSGALTLASGGVAQLGYRSQDISPATPETVPNNIALMGGAIFANDNYQHLSGALNVTANGGTLGSTYSGTTYNLNKGLFVDGVVSGSGSLTILQAGGHELSGWGNEQGNSYNVGIVMFSNPANSYSGTISVVPYNAGGGDYLAVNNSTALQYATVNLTGDNTGSTRLYGASTLLFQTGLGSATLGGLSGSGDLSLTGMNELIAVSGSDAIALTIGANGANTTYSGAMSGAGSLTKVGAGTTVLANSNAYSGTTAVNGGVLAVTGTINTSAVYDGETSAGAVAVSRSGVVSATSVFIGLNSGAAGAYVQTGGLLKANGTAYNASNGVGVVVGSATGSSGTLNISGGTINGGAPLMVWGGKGTITVSQTGSAPTLLNPAWITLGQLSGAVGAMVQNSGAVVTQNDNLYIGWGAGAAGHYYLHGGTLTANDIRTDWGTGTMYQDGGSATANAWLRLGIDSGANSSYTLAGGSLTLNGAEANVGENGAGTLTIGGSNGGSMFVSSASTLTLANGAGSGTLNLLSGGLLRTPDVAEGHGSATFNFSGGTLRNSASSGLVVSMPVNLSGPGTVDIDSSQTGVFPWQAPISGSGSLYLTGGGTLTLSGTNTYTGGTVVASGDLLLTSSSAIEAGTGLTVGDASLFAVPMVTGLQPSASVDAAAMSIAEPGTLLLLATGAFMATAALRRKRS